MAERRSATFVQSVASAMTVHAPAGQDGLQDWSVGSVSAYASTCPSGSPRPSTSGNACPCSVNDSDTELRQ